MRIDPELRERASINVIDTWPWKLGGALIGGYAVSSYGKPRYSDDLDIVIPHGIYSQVHSWLDREGFSLDKSTIPNPQNYEGQVYRYSRDTVTVDILSGAVRDRDARVDIPATWVLKEPRIRRLVLLKGRTVREIPVARLEALWGLKLQSGRDTDLTDLFVLSQLKFDEKEVKQLFAELTCESLSAKLSEVRKKARQKKIYEDSMSGLEMKRTDRSRRDWERFCRLIERITML